MKQIIWISAAALVVAGVVIAQGPTDATGTGKSPAKGQDTKAAKGQAKGPPRSPVQSPASRPGPQTVTPQVYSAEQIQAGELRFTAQCGFCHGRDAAGGETGPDLTRSKLVAEDTRGDKLVPFLAQGRPEQGMPAFKLSATDLGAIVAFVHDEKAKSEVLGGGRRSVDPADLATGSAQAGRVYFNGEGGCSGCHSATGDLAGIATRYQGLALLQRMLYPTGRPAPARPKVTLSLASGRTIVAPLASEDEFTVSILNSDGTKQSYEKTAAKFKIDDPMSAHFTQLGKYTDDDMHNVFAYLDTLK